MKRKRKFNYTVYWYSDEDSLHDEYDIAQRMSVKAFDEDDAEEQALYWLEQENYHSAIITEIRKD